MTSPASRSPEGLVPLPLPVQADLLPETHRQAWNILEKSCEVLYDLVDQNRDDIDGLARVEIMVEAIRKQLAVIQEDAKKYLNEASGEYQFTVEGIGTYIKVMAGAKDEWDSEQCWNEIAAVAERTNVDEQTGEVRNPFQWTVSVAQRFLRPSWRSTPFKDAGIDVKDLRDRIGGRPSVRRQ